MMLLFLSLMACNDPCSAGSDPTLELGWGWNDFHAAADDQELELVYGQQGSFHVDLAVSATDLDGSDLVSANFSGTLNDEVVGEAQPWFDLVCDSDTKTQQAFGLRLIFWDSLPPELDGQSVLVEGTVRDARGVQASASHTYTIIDPF